MSVRVLKWYLPIPSRDWRAALEIPVSAQILSCGLEPDERMVVWALVDEQEDQTPAHRRLVVANTGVQIPDFPEDARFLGTLRTKNGIVWHVWEDLS